MTSAAVLECIDMSERDILQQFYRDCDRIRVRFSTPQHEERPVSLKRQIIAWWLSRVQNPGALIDDALPESIFVCFYWCTQASLADVYVKFIKQRGIFDSATRHLLDDGPHHILFRDDGLISIEKPFRESVIDGSDETVAQRWLLMIVADPRSAAPYSPPSLHWQRQSDKNKKNHTGLLVASFSVGVAIAAARMLRG